MIKVVDNKSNGVVEFVADEKTDVNSLPITDIEMGSNCFVIEDSSVLMFGSDKAWHYIVDNSGGGGGGSSEMSYDDLIDIYFTDACMIYVDPESMIKMTEEIDENGNYIIDISNFPTFNENPFVYGKVKQIKLKLPEEGSSGGDLIITFFIPSKDFNIEEIEIVDTEITIPINNVMPEEAKELINLDLVNEKKLFILFLQFSFDMEDPEIIGDVTALCLPCNVKTMYQIKQMMNL